MDSGGVAQIAKKQGDAVLEVYQRRSFGASNGSLAVFLNNQGVKTMKGGKFTAHAGRDILNCRFYLGKVSDNGEYFQGQHEALISEELFKQAQGRKQAKRITRTVAGEWSHSRHHRLRPLRERRAIRPTSIGWGNVLRTALSRMLD